MRRPFADKRPIGPFSKESLSLPLIDNLGQDSSTSTNVGNIVFRGASLGSLNSDEFQNNNIDGRTINVWTMDTAAAVKRYNVETEKFGNHQSRYFSNGARNTDLEDKLIDEFRIGVEDTNDFGVDTGAKEVPIKSLAENNLIARHITTDVTGGLSKRLGMSIRFAGSAYDGIERFPIVMFLEKNRIPARLVEAEYNSEFVNEHPAIAGAADSGSKMLVCPKLTEDFELGKYSAQFGVSPSRKADDLREEGDLLADIDSDDLVVQWYIDPLDNFRGLEAESELFAYAPKIDLDSALFGMCSYVTDSRLKSVSQTDSDNIEDMVESIYSRVQNNLNSYQDRLVMCVLDTKPRSGSKKIKNSQFKMLYDGQSFTRTYREAAPFTNPEMF
jgi:hypothetical protein